MTSIWRTHNTLTEGEEQYFLKALGNKDRYGNIIKMLQELCVVIASCGDRSFEREGFMEMMGTHIKQMLKMMVWIEEQFQALEKEEQNQEALKADLKDQESFRDTCRMFLIELAKEIYVRFPFDDKNVKFLENIKFLDPSNLKYIRDVTIAAQFFNFDLEDVDCEYKSLRRRFKDNFDPDVVLFWCKVESLRHGDGSPEYPLLIDLVQRTLLLPHVPLVVIFSDQELKYRFLLAACNRVDDLKRFLAPGVKLPSSRIDRWQIILSLKNKHAVAFRKLLEEAGIKSDDDRLLFCEALSKLCRDTNKRAAHTYVEMPEANEKIIRDALKVMGIKADHIIVQGFLLIARELPNPDAVVSTSEKTE